MTVPCISCAPACVIGRRRKTVFVVSGKKTKFSSNRNITSNKQRTLQRTHTHTHTHRRNNDSKNGTNKRKQNDDSGGARVEMKIHFGRCKTAVVAGAKRNTRRARSRLVRVHGAVESVDHQTAPPNDARRDRARKRANPRARQRVCVSTQRTRFNTPTSARHSRFECATDAAHAMLHAIARIAGQPRSAAARHPRSRTRRRCSFAPRNTRAPHTAPRHSPAVVVVALAK